jgi:hypothetical protein
VSLVRLSIISIILAISEKTVCIVGGSVYIPLAKVENLVVQSDAVSGHAA